MADTQTQRTQRGQKYQSPGHYTAKDRDKIAAETPEDFAGPDETFPIKTQADVHDAARLIGHAKDPAAVKAKIKSIAKRKGFSLPDAWQNEQEDEDKERMTEAYVTRSTDASETPYSDDSVTRFVLPSEVRLTDSSRREFEVCATSEAVDSYQTVFGFEASKRAFSNWTARNIREMHQPIAAGRALDVRFDDAEKKVWVRGRISRGAEPTWLKLEDGVLQGASIGASDVKWEWRDIDGQRRRYAVDYKLVELSLVDSPSNPSSYGVQLIRSAVPAEDVLDELETEEERAVREAEEERIATAKAQAEADVAAFLNPENAAAEMAAEMRSGAEAANNMTMVTSTPTLPAAYQPPQQVRQVSPVATSTGFNVAPIADALDIALPDPATYLVNLEQILTTRSATPGSPDRVQVARPVLEATVLRREEIAAKERYLADARAQMQNIQVAPFDEHRETYADYLARVQGATAAAEARALAKWNAYFQPLVRRAQGKPARLPGQPLETVQSSQQTQQAVVQRDASPALMACPHCGNDMPSAAETCPHCAKSPDAPVVPAAPLPETYQAPTDTSRVDNRGDAPFDIGEVKTAPTPAPAVPGTEQPAPHIGASHIGSTHEEHHNVINAEHEHLAADNVTKMRHTHPHIDTNHVHTFRNGQPTDSRLVVAETVRLPFGTTAPNPPMGSMFSFKESGQSQTVGGAAGNGSTSPVVTVQPQAVGKRVLYNTQDAAALEAGVPNAAEERPTPTTDITLDPGAFHEGGHQVAGTPDRETNGGASTTPGAEFDQDGDHDGAADDAQPALVSQAPRPTRIPPAAPTVKNSGKPNDSLGQVNTLNPGMRSAESEVQRSLPDTYPALGANASNKGQIDTLSLPHDQSGPGEDDDSGEYAAVEGDDGDADDVQIAARPPRPTPIEHNAPATFEAGRDPQDTTLAIHVSGPVPNGGMSAQSASSGVSGGLTRAGQRLSAESRAEMHGMRDVALDAVKRACAHCNGDGECPECDTLLRVINAGQYGPEGNHLPAGSPDVSNDTAMFGSLRVMTALLTRELAQTKAELRAEMDSYFRAQAAGLETMYSELRTMIADTQLTLVDHQRGYSAEVTRAVQADVQQNLQNTHSLLSADLRQLVSTQVEASVSPLLQRLEALAAVAAETEADVKRMADQPSPAAIAMMPHSGVNATLPMNQPDYAALSQAAQMRHGLVHPAAAAAQSGQVQVEVLQAFANSLPPNDPARMSIAERLTSASRHLLNGGQGTMTR